MLTTKIIIYGKEKFKKLFSVWRGNRKGKKIRP
jgi:hypothetical protein